MTRVILSLAVLAMVTILAASGKNNGHKPLDLSPCTATCGLCGATCQNKGAHSAHHCRSCGHMWHD